MTLSSYGGFIGVDENLLDNDPQPLNFGFPHSSFVTSGRAALYYLTKDVDVLYVPSFLCKEAIRFIPPEKIRSYSSCRQLVRDWLTSPLTIKVLFVDYLGLNKADRTLLEPLGSSVIYDYTLNLYDWYYHSCSQAFASVRKWFGLADGAIIHNTYTAAVPNLMVYPSQLTRNSRNQKNYGGFLENERGFNYETCGKDAISDYSNQLLQRINHRQCRSIREKNRSCYELEFKKYNTFSIAGIPLYYPLMLDYDVTPMRQALIKQKIYIPTLWKETAGELSLEEVKLRDNVLLLPVDYRYNHSDIVHIAIKVKELHEKYHRQSAAQDSRR